MKTELIAQAQEYAARIDQFLIKREKSVLSKFIAIGGATEGESFEVQAKVRIQDPAPILEAIQKSDLEILRHRHYHEFDTYFSFDDPEQGYLRYREDEFLSENDQVSNVRYRLTLIGPAREGAFQVRCSYHAAVLLPQPPTACAFTGNISNPRPN